MILKAVELCFWCLNSKQATKESNYIKKFFITWLCFHFGSAHRSRPGFVASGLISDLGASGVDPVWQVCWPEHWRTAPPRRATEKWGLTSSSSANVIFPTKSNLQMSLHFIDKHVLTLKGFLILSSLELH